MNTKCRPSPFRRASSSWLVGAALGIGALGLVGSAANAATFRVGPGGTHTTIQAAMNAAAALAGDDEVRVAVGTYAESVSISSGHLGAVTLSGGWSANFTVNGAGTTTIAGSGQNTSITVGSSSSTRQIRDLRLLGGVQRRALEVSASDSNVTIERCTIEGADGSLPLGTAASLAAYSSVVTLKDNLIINNRSTDRTGAVSLSVTGGTLTVSGNHFVGNEQLGDGQVDGAALLVDARSGSTTTISDNLFLENHGGGPVHVAVAARIHVDGAAPQSTAVIARNRFIDNRSTVQAVTPQLDLVVINGAAMEVTDSLFVGDAGFRLTVVGGSAHLTNLTVDVATSAAVTVSGFDQATATLANSLLSSAPQASSQELVVSDTLVGGHPRFVNPAARDYRLLPDSPAIDAGNNDPPGGPLGSTDLASNPRVTGIAVDLGAYEVGPSPCVTDSDTLCLGGRFAVDLAWETPNDRGLGQATNLTNDTGYFWFFNPANVELVVKSVDGCALNARHWVFAGGLTDVATAMAVTDTTTGAIRRYDNVLGTPFSPLQDTAAFAACP